MGEHLVPAAVHLDWLLELDGQVIVVDEHGRYFVKFAVARVEKTTNRPHGIRYGFTLHDAKTGQRLLGFDNAHAVRQPRRGFRGKIVTYDHRHRSPGDQGVSYTFSGPGQLVEDFWAAVGRYLDENG